MIEAALEALNLLAQPERFGFMLAGIAVGITIGILPGLGGTTGMALLLPLIYGMDRISAIALLMGMSAVTTLADAFPSILMGVPGTAGAQATIMDGYPLAQQGQARRALGAAFTASAAGAAIGAGSLVVSIYFARPLILAFGSPELLMLSVLGLSAVAVLSKGNALAGLLMACFGLILGSVGGAPAVMQYRFTFGSLYLYDGVPIAVVALALFGIPELVDLLIRNRPISESGRVEGRLRDGMTDVLRNKWLVGRSSLIGTGVGIVPGLGGAVVDWIAYALGQRTIRDNHFGKGDVRGVIAPEAAASAKEGGALIPTLLFGIPGSSSMAILLGGFIIIGIDIGPDMVTTNLDITLSIVWTLIVANIIAAFVCGGLGRWVAKVATFPAKLFTPPVLVIVLLGAYQSTRHWGDLIALLSLGAVAWLMKTAGWPRPPLMIGFVLSTATERYLHLSMSIYGLSFLTRPVVVVLLIATIALVWGSLRHQGVAPERASDGLPTTTVLGEAGGSGKEDH